MRWKFWVSSNGRVDTGPTLQELQGQIAKLTTERNHALEDSRKMGTVATRTRVGRVLLDPIELTSNLRRVVPDIRVELVGYTLVMTANHTLTEAEHNGIEALCPFTIDRT